jgi:hypothetical protein
VTTMTAAAAAASVQPVTRDLNASAAPAAAGATAALGRIIVTV